MLNYDKLVFFTLISEHLPNLYPPFTLHLTHQNFEKANRVLIILNFYLKSRTVQRHLSVDLGALVKLFGKGRHSTASGPHVVLTA